MALEIERKFLVTSDAYKKESVKQTQIIQGYLSSAPERSVRVRIKGNKGYITIKGKSNDTGTSRYEWEKEILVSEAEELLRICELGVIHKTRFEVNVGAFTFEVDEFYGDNQGLVVAEVELSDELDQFDKPEWVGEEVTGDVRYYNSMLKRQPYTTWT